MRQKNARILPLPGKKGGKGSRNTKMMMPNGLSQEITQPYSQSMSQVRFLDCRSFNIPSKMDFLNKFVINFFELP